MRRDLVVVLAVVVAASCKSAPTSSPSPEAAAPSPPREALSFARDGAPPTSLAFADLAAKIPPETVAGFDPYYKKDKRFSALPLEKVLEVGFGLDAKTLAGKEFIFRAKDGYAVYFRGALAVEEGGYVAFEDLEVPGWEPIGNQKANPAPFYVVWKKQEQADLETHPRPWQLVKIEMLKFEAAYPHTSPGELSETEPAMRGYHLFRDRCFKCHAINREGGRVGPDLNVPRNVLEYRPEDQVRAYVKNPASFRYGNMPAHPDLTDADLDTLVAYLRAMQARKHDEGK